MLLRRKVPKVTSLRARPHARVRESAHLTDTVREPAIEERLIGWPAAIIYLTKQPPDTHRPGYEPDEIEVTDAMIAAGVDALVSARADLWGDAPDLVRDVLLAALQAARSAPAPE